MKISIIGCGRMGSKIAERLAGEHKVVLSDHDQDKTTALAKLIGGDTTASPKDAVKGAEIIILAVKPHDFSTLAEEVQGAVQPEQLIVSVMGGIPVWKLRQMFPENPVIRMMPNIPVQYGRGVVGIVEEEGLSDKLKETTEQVFSCLGALHWFPESKMDAITSLTGSGPAFVFVMLEAVVDAGIAMGIPAEKAKELAIELFEGSLTMLQETGKHPGELKWEVASPGGTTIAGLKTMEDHGVRSGIINTFLATYQRSKEL